MISCIECQKVFKSERALSGHQSIHKVGPRFSKSRKRLPLMTCLSCGTDVLKRNSKYCNSTCRSKYKWEIKKDQIGSGERSTPKILKRIIIEIHGEFCSICSLGNVWNERRLSLQLDHIDGNSDNNHFSNLRLLCPNCHSQTDTWCARNIDPTERSAYKKKYYKRIVSQMGRQ